MPPPPPKKSAAAMSPREEEEQNEEAEEIAREQMAMMAAASGLSPEEYKKQQDDMENGYQGNANIQDDDDDDADVDHEHKTKHHRSSKKHHHHDDDDDDDEDDRYHRKTSALLGKAAVIDIPIEEQLRRLLVHFFICYAPQRLIEIPTQLDRLTQSGATAVQVYKRLKAEYNTVPCEGEALNILKQSFITRLYCFFARYNHSQFRNVPYLAKKYQGAQRELFVELETKYGQDQDPLRLFGKDEKNEKEDLDKLLDDRSSSESDDFDELDRGGAEASGVMMMPSHGNFGSGEKDIDALNNTSSKNVLSQSNNNVITSSSANNNNNKNNQQNDDDDDEEDDYYRRSDKENAMYGGGGRGGGGGDDTDIHDALEKVGVDPTRLRQPLPRFHDPLGTANVSRVAPEDLEML